MMATSLTVIVYFPRFQSHANLTGVPERALHAAEPVPLDTGEAVKLSFDSVAPRRMNCEL
jgi:hypothetical protein